MGPTTPSHNLLHSFCIRPDIAFESQSPDEEVILVLRAHPITQLPWIFNSLVFILGLILLNLLLPTFLDPSQILFIDIFGLAVIFAYVWFNFLNWFFNVGIVTNQRVVDVDFTNIIYKEVTATRLGKIEDVTSKSGGYFQSLFNYGDVLIQTAGENENIEFIKVPFPSRAVEIINDLMPK